MPAEHRTSLFCCKGLGLYVGHDAILGSRLTTGVGLADLAEFREQGRFHRGRRVDYGVVPPGVFSITSIVAVAAVSWAAAGLELDCDGTRRQIIWRGRAW